MKLKKGSVLPVVRLANDRAALAVTPKGRRKALESALKAVDTKKLKLTAAAAGGGVLLLSAVGSVARYETFRAAVSRELKKQLAPINAKLNELEKQNEELRRELERR